MMNEPIRMRATASDVRLVRLISRSAKYLLLPLAVLVVAMKVVGWIHWPWWLVLAPTMLYLLHPLFIGGLGVFLQYRRHHANPGVDHDT